MFDTPVSRAPLEGVRNHGCDCGRKSAARSGLAVVVRAAHARCGVTAKLSCGGGDEVVHSSVVACHGFAVVRAPRASVSTRFTMKNSCAAPRPDREPPLPRVEHRDPRAVRIRAAAVVEPAVDAGEALDEHRHEHAVHADERSPEVQLAEPLVQHPSGDFRKPVVDARQTARRACPARRRSESGR